MLHRAAPCSVPVVLSFAELLLALLTASFCPSLLHRALPRWCAPLPRRLRAHLQGAKFVAASVGERPFLRLAGRSGTGPPAKCGRRLWCRDSCQVPSGWMNWLAGSHSLTHTRTHEHMNTHTQKHKHKHKRPTKARQSGCTQLTYAKIALLISIRARPSGRPDGPLAPPSC